MRKVTKSIKIRRTVRVESDAIILEESLTPSTPTITRIPWGNILKVIAYKRDLFAYDLICLAIATSENTIEIDEEMDGWEQLLSAFPRFLPGILTTDQWLQRVVQPAFATNEILLYLRS